MTAIDEHLKAGGSPDLAKITTPGVFDLEMSQYHSDCCVGPSISSSGLREIETKTPAHYYATSYLNTDRIERDTPAMSFGRAAHTLLLGDEPFEQSFVIAPFTNWNTNQFDGEIDGAVRGDWKKASKSDWKRHQLEDGKTIVMPKDYKTICEMRDVIAKHPIVQGGIFEGEIEKSIIWQDEETGVWLKARPDVIPHVDASGFTMDDTLSDYKTIEDASPLKIMRAMIDRGYAQQLALCAEGLWHTRKQVIRCFTLIFQEKKPPYAVVAQEIGADFIWRAAQLNRRAINTFAQCVKNDDWPAYDIPSPINPPDWLHKRLQAEEDANLLPHAPAWCEQIKQQELAA